jgi:hypothetical protein
MHILGDIALLGGVALRLSTGHGDQELICFAALAGVITTVGLERHHKEDIDISLVPGWMTAAHRVVAAANPHVPNAVLLGLVTGQLLPVMIALAVVSNLDWIVVYVLGIAVAEHRQRQTPGSHRDRGAMRRRGGVYSGR